MLESWIIEELLKREEQQRPELRIEIEPPMPVIEQAKEEPKEERGVFIIDLLG